MTPSAVWRLIPAKRWEVIALDIEALRKPRAQPVGVASWLQVPYHLWSCLIAQAFEARGSKADGLSLDQARLNIVVVASLDRSVSGHDAPSGSSSPHSRRRAIGPRSPHGPTVNGMRTVSLSSKPLMTDGPSSCRLERPRHLPISFPMCCRMFVMVCVVVSWQYEGEPVIVTSMPAQARRHGRH